MKICLIGAESCRPDEGMRVILASLKKVFSGRHEVLTLSPQQSLRVGFWSRISFYSPDVIHYIPGPSLLSFILCRMIAKVFPTVPVIMSAPLPLVPKWALGFLRFLQPDLLMTQSTSDREAFLKLGIPARVLPISGVDIGKYSPLTAPGDKERLRKKYGIPKDDYVVLHVGHIKRKRNVQVMAELVRLGIQPVLVAGSSTGMDNGLHRRLLQAGCIVETRFVERMEEYYRLADLYLFPVPPAQSSACITVPLSVLEALSCNLPVLTTRFGALPEILSGAEGACMVSESGIIDRISTLMQKTPCSSIHLREIAEKFAWPRIGASLETAYNELRTEKSNSFQRNSR